MPGNMTEAPALLAQLDLGRSAPSLTVVTAEDGETIGLALVNGGLHCYDMEGRLLWKAHPLGLNFTAITAVEDLNGDGKKEILLQSGRPTPPFGAAVLLDLADGAVIWRYDVEPMSYAWYLYAGNYLPDVESKQIVVIMHGYPPDAENGYMALFAYPADGEAPEMKWRYAFDKYTCFPSFLQDDIDGDGVKELVVETHSRMWFMDAVSGEVKEFLEWDVSPANVRSYGLVEFTDLDGDGDDDFLCIATFAQHHEVLLHDSGTFTKAWHYGWPESVTTGKVATTWPSPKPYGDLDGDGKLEVVVSMYNSEDEQAWQVRVYDAVTGELKYRMPGMIASHLEDVDGDGLADLLCSASTDPAQAQLNGAHLVKVKDGRLEVVWGDDAAQFTQKGNLRRGEAQFTVRIDDGEIILAPMEVEQPVSPFTKTPAVAGGAMPTLLAADVDSDGVNELVMYRDTKVTVLEIDGGSLVESGQYTSSALPVFADLDGDGKTEIVLCDVTPTAPPVVTAITPANNDAILWKNIFAPPERPGLPQPRIAYMRTARFTGQSTPDLYLWAGTPVVRSAGLNGRTGEILWDKGEVPDSERYWGASVNYASAYDYNGDGNEDLVFTNPDYYCVADGLTGDFLLGPLFPPNIFDQPSQGLYTFPAILDRAAEKPLVALVGGHYFQGVMTIAAEPVWYKLPTAGENRCSHEGFLQAGGKWRMGVGRQDGQFAVVDVQSGDISSKTSSGMTFSDIVAADVDGDGAPEFLFGGSHGGVHALAVTGDTPSTLWKIDTAAGTGTPLAADLTGDGQIEIAFTTADGYVKVHGTRGAP